MSSYYSDQERAPSGCLYADLSGMWLLLPFLAPAWLTVLQDVNMPTMDGLVATKHIRTIEAASTTQSISSREPSGSCSSDSTTEAVGWQPSRRVPIVGVSACSSADQLKSKALDGVQLDPATGLTCCHCPTLVLPERAPVNGWQLKHVILSST